MKDLNTSAPSANRVASVDLLRALNMVLMIFVNDLWSLSCIPEWLEHVAGGVDGIGLADTVFPAFLVIVGLSMPFAIEARRQRGETDLGLLKHVLFRTTALLVMGVFLVNGESINEAATGIQRLVWNTLCCLSFIAIWNSYPKSIRKTLVYVFKGIGISTLLVLAIIYRGGDEKAINYFGPSWWGILGLIGWAYLASGLVTIWARNNIYKIVAGWLVFVILSMLTHAGMIPDAFNFIPDAIRGGTLVGLALSGVVTAWIFQYYKMKGDNTRLAIALLFFSVALIILSVITRPYWGLAKLGATPAWLFLCSAFTIIAFLIVYWIADVWHKASWFTIIKPAGTDTLLCYLLPYFAYAFTNLAAIHLPEFALIGAVGLMKSCLFAILCAIIAGWLSKAGIKLKL